MSKTRTIIVEVYGGCVTGVSDLPAGWNYEIIDYDNYEEFGDAIDTIPRASDVELEHVAANCDSERIKAAATDELARRRSAQPSKVAAAADKQQHGGKGEWRETYWDYEEGDSAIVGDDDGADDLPVCLLPPGSPWGDLIVRAPKLVAILERVTDALWARLPKNKVRDTFHEQVLIQEARKEIAAAKGGEI